MCADLGAYKYLFLPTNVFTDGSRLKSSLHSLTPAQFRTQYKHYLGIYQTSKELSYLAPEI
jgi:hypothetical protein